MVISEDEVQHSHQLLDFSILVKLWMHSRESAWSRTCAAMYKLPKHTSESVPLTYMAWNHILWCIYKMKEDSTSPICAFYTEYRGQISVRMEPEGPKIHLTYFTTRKNSQRKFCNEMCSIVCIFTGELAK